MAETRDKTRNKAQQIKGKAKETAGRATGDRGLRAKGTSDRKKGKAKQAAGRVRNTLRK
jgi:uncharacterized protein YjbJ (UPF0337 family)